MATDGAHGPQPSRTGGPWHLLVRDALLYPDTRAVSHFIELVGQVAGTRQTDPLSLLADAKAQVAMNNWTRAEELVESAFTMYRRRRWSRDAPAWYELLLLRAHVAMQLGVTGGAPYHSNNILRSLTKQGLDGVDAAFVRARALHIASLVWGQRTEPFTRQRMLTALQSAEDVLQGVRTRRAVAELFRIRARLELAAARTRGEANPPATSAILEAARALPEFKEEGRVRYGQTLLRAGKPSRALDYIRPALESGNLSKPAWFVAERLNAAAEWQMGVSSDATLEKLAAIREEARRLGFQHQLLVIRRQARRVRRKDRNAVM
jgi:hypothetical protein